VGRPKFAGFVMYHNGGPPKEGEGLADSRKGKEREVSANSSSIS